MIPRQIFISYRRDDDPGMALALHAHLAHAFSEERIFMDVEGGIDAGDDFVKVLQERVAECDIMLAIIGKGWLSARDSKDRRRLDNPDDFIRIEIESAIGLGKRVIPVLINNTEMPQASELPETMTPLARRQAVWITSKRLRADAEGLIRTIKGHLQEAAEPQKNPKSGEIEQRRDPGRSLGQTPAPKLKAPAGAATSADKLKVAGLLSSILLGGFCFIAAAAGSVNGRSPAIVFGLICLLAAAAFWKSL